jgi:streptogrisin C
MARRSVIAAATLSAAGLVATVALTHDATAATAPAAAPAPAPAAAAPPPGITAEHFAAVQRDLRLTADQARARLATDRTAGDIQALYQATEVDGYAGTYVEADGRVVVNVTEAADGADARARGATVRVVRNSEDDLAATVARLDRARRPAGIVGWNTDVAGNAVVVRAKPESVADVRAWLAKRRFDAAAVRVEATDEAPRPLADIIGGSPYFIGNSRCSVGFSVEGGFVTAGHCGRNGATTRQPGGRFAGSSFPGDDHGWVRTSAGETPRPLVRNNGGTVAVAGSTQAAVGSTVCRSGSTTGWHCGTIQAFNTSVSYPQGTVSGLIRTNVCAEPGDSGGSLVAGNQAQGMTSGGSGNCRTGGTTYFQPVNEALRVYGLRLLTSAGGTPPPPPPTAAPNPPYPPTPPAGATTWAPNRTYATGATVTYAGTSYRCLQGHTAQVGWEPANVPALWARA